MDPTAESTNFLDDQVLSGRQHQRKYSLRSFWQSQVGKELRCCLAWLGRLHLPSPNHLTLLCLPEDGTHADVTSASAGPPGLSRST